MMVKINEDTMQTECLSHFCDEVTSVIDGPQVFILILIFLTKAQ